MSDSEESVGEDGREVIRTGYRKLMDVIAGDEDELGTLQQEEEGRGEGEGGRQLLGFLKENDTLYQQSATAQEAVMDARVLKQLSRLCRKQAEQMSSNIAQFRPDEYCSKLMGNMAGGGGLSRRKWVLLGSQVKAMFRRSPPLTYMYGALDTIPPTPKEKKEREVRASQPTRIKDLKETVCSELAEAEKQENQTEQMVGHVFKALVKGYRDGGREPLCFFKFVLDPHSFGASVENLFHVSFLVKEGKAKIDVDGEGGLPTICPLGSKNKEGDGDPIKNQVVINFNMAEWKMLVDGLRIRDAMIQRSSDAVDSQLVNNHQSNKRIRT